MCLYPFKISRTCFNLIGIFRGSRFRNPISVFGCFSKLLSSNPTRVMVNFSGFVLRSVPMGSLLKEIL